METHLDAGGAPLYEVGQLALSDSLQTFVHLSGVNLTLQCMQRKLTAVPGSLTACVTQLKEPGTGLQFDWAHAVEEMLLTWKGAKSGRCKRCANMHYDGRAYGPESCLKRPQLDKATCNSI